MTTDHYCVICGKWIGNHNTGETDKGTASYYSIIKRKYCDTCNAWKRKQDLRFNQHEFRRRISWSFGNFPIVHKQVIKSKILTKIELCCIIDNTMTQVSIRDITKKGRRVAFSCPLCWLSYFFRLSLSSHLQM